MYEPYERDVGNCRGEAKQGMAYKIKLRRRE